ncbi:flagellar hook-length control protein FliK [Thermosyntropha sp.]|uniref:flagellar hook-length control protein FliK n=1 Tax=Thermosyntropha sp. TaxID=2740820 RepID=UPI0025F8DA70|nr:flagellar hook-length control protein FliK [Thermosyntropha sp.]MBO8159352.1 flagellar hook-length control protein FliK [Thermosyntropha sp.]
MINAAVQGKNAFSLEMKAFSDSKSAYSRESKVKADSFKKDFCDCLNREKTNSMISSVSGESDGEDSAKPDDLKATSSAQQNEETESYVKEKAGIEQKDIVFSQDNLLLLVQILEELLDCADGNEKFEVEQLASRLYSNFEQELKKEPVEISKVYLELKEIFRGNLPEKLVPLVKDSVLAKGMPEDFNKLISILRETVNAEDDGTKSDVFPMLTKEKTKSAFYYYMRNVSDEPTEAKQGNLRVLFPEAQGNETKSIADFEYFKLAGKKIESSLRVKAENFDSSLDAEGSKSNVPWSDKLVNSFRGTLASNSAFLSRMPQNTREVFEQIVQKAELMLKQGLSEMKIELKPEFLGKMTIKILVEEGAVTARFIAENYQVKHLLENNLNTLKQTLENQGLKVEKAEVSVQLNNGGMFDGSENSRQFMWERPEFFMGIAEGSILKGEEKSEADVVEPYESTGEGLYGIYDKTSSMNLII